MSKAWIVGGAVLGLIMLLLVLSGGGGGSGSVGGY